MRKPLFQNQPSLLVAIIAASVIGAACLLGARILSNAVVSTGLTPAPTVIALDPSKTAAANITDASSIIADTVMPEAATGLQDSAALAVTAQDYMVVAAHPAAAQAGAMMIERGGTAIDAAIAAQMVLNLVEPQSSGIGGGGFMLHWNAHKRRLDTYDGRETAPQQVKDTLFLREDGNPMRFWDAVIGGRSVGVPGLLRMLEMAHDAHGALEWRTLFAPAITLAEQGFPISPRLHRLLSRARGLSDTGPARAYFFQADGSPKPIGSLLKNPAFAETLREIADKGANAFYEGPIAEDIVNTVQTARTNPGTLSLVDLRSYQAIRRQNLCRPYRQYLVCGMPPPSSGGIAIAQALTLLEGVDLAAMRPQSAEAIRAVAEASALAFADRNQFVADPDAVSVPINGLLDRRYLANRALLMDLSSEQKRAKLPGKPPGTPRDAETRASGIDLALPSTTHLSVIAPNGDAVSMTTSIETGFGSRLMVRGFLLNNQLTDFSFRAQKDGALIANRVEAGKRPRSSMSPTLVFDADRNLLLATGSPGGSRIIGYTLQSILNILDWGMSPQEAAAAPRYLHRNTGRLELEQTIALDARRNALTQMGYDVKSSAMASGLHIIRRSENGLEGGVDPRREGAAVGETLFDADLNNAFRFIRPVKD